MKKLIKSIHNLFFKENLTCNACGREVFNDEYFCPDCKKSLESLYGAYICQTCGRRTPQPMESCFTCKGGWQISFARSPFIYDGIVVELIHNYKYKGKRYIANSFLPYLLRTYFENKFDCDAVTFVPCNNDRLFERGFNNSKFLAEIFAKKVDLPLIAPLFKKEDFKNQVGLTAKERAKNIVNSFGFLDKKCVKGKSILLVDDVLTTGATSGEIAKMLLSAGAKKVSLLTVASVKSDFFQGF